MKIALIDTIYPEFLKTLPFDSSSSYERELAAVLSHSFGTADFYSRNLRALGHECIDIIANHSKLQHKWIEEEGWAGDYSDIDGLRYIAFEQIREFNPDVVFMQDLSFFDHARLMDLAGSYLLAGQCSCPMPRQENVSPFRALMTSFPHYVKRFESLGVRGIYMPLAFEPRLLGNVEVTHFGSTEREFIWGGRKSDPKRDIEISFCGGVGRESHWRAGTDALEAVASEFGARFQWYGYGRENLPAASALRGCYRGEAWGRRMYEIYRRSKIVINRHGEVAHGFTNNLRCFEATGMGALLMTEDSPNLMSLFPLGTVCPYKNAEDLIGQIYHFLAHDEARESIAAYGQKHTLEHHTYAQRMKVVSTVLQEMLVNA